MATKFLHSHRVIFQTYNREVYRKSVMKTLFGNFLLHRSWCTGSRDQFTSNKDPALWLDDKGKSIVKTKKNKYNRYNSCDSKKTYTKNLKHNCFKICKMRFNNYYGWCTLHCLTLWFYNICFFFFSKKKTVIERQLLSSSWTNGQRVAAPSGSMWNESTDWIEAEMNWLTAAIKLNNRPHF